MNFASRTTAFAQDITLKYVQIMHASDSAHNSLANLHNLRKMHSAR